MLRDFEHQTRIAVLNLQGVEDGRQLAVKLHVDDGTDDGDDLARRTHGSSLRSRLEEKGGGSVGVERECGMVRSVVAKVVVRVVRTMEVVRMVEADMGLL